MFDASPISRKFKSVSRLLAKRAVSAERQSEPTVNSQLNLNQELPDIFLPKTSKCCLTRLSGSDPLHPSTFILFFKFWLEETKAAVSTRAWTSLESGDANKLNKMERT